MEIDPDECIRLLSTVSVGRVGLSLNAMPVIVTVDFAVDGDDLSFRTQPGTKLADALAGNVVCFQAEDAGWSLNVTGTALVEGGWAHLDLRHSATVVAQ